MTDDHGLNKLQQHIMGNDIDALRYRSQMQAIITQKEALQRKQKIAERNKDNRAWLKIAAQLFELERDFDRLVASQVQDDHD